MDTERTQLIEDLRSAVTGEVLAGAAPASRRYATDASNFRQDPLAVVIPASIEEVMAIHAVCAAHGAPILPRGAGTSISGAAVNQAVVIDFTRHLNRVGPVDVERRQVSVQPGAINDQVNALAARHGLRFGPDPASHATCTIGGNIGCNACGVHSVQSRFQGTGSRTSDNLAALDVLTYDGLRLSVGPTSPAEIGARVAAGGRPGEIYRLLVALRDRYADRIRERFPAIPRRVSGYNLDDLLPERGFNLAGALAGTEGTCVSVLGATLKLIALPQAVSLLVIGYAGLLWIGDHLGEILAARPLACETFDASLLAGTTVDGRLPEGQAWVLVELGGATEQEAAGRAADLAARLHRAPRPPSGIRCVDDPAEAHQVWRIREEAVHHSTQAGTHPGWEDSAVPPEGVGPYLRDLRRLLDRYGYRGAFYGHLGDGCIHTRTDFDLDSAEGIGRYRRFLEEAADLVVAHRGSLSGEHGDGQQRAELLPRMFGPELVAAFAEFKAIWDPRGGMNPGKVVSPYRLDQHLNRTSPPAAVWG